MIISLGCWLPNTSCNLPGDFGRAALKHLPIWSCSEWGLPCPSCHHEGGELLPRLFTLACITGGLFSVALSLSHPRFALRTTLPCRVRTFLSSIKPERSCAHSKSFTKLYYSRDQGLFSLFKNWSLMVHQTLTDRAVKHCVPSEEYIILLRRN